MADPDRPPTELELKLRIGTRYGQLIVAGPLRRGFIEVVCNCQQRRLARPSELISGAVSYCGYKVHSAWTYVIWAPQAKLIKVGNAVSIEARARNIQAMSPIPLRLVRVSKSFVEYDVHQELDKHRQHGEWFSDLALKRIDKRGDFIRVDADVMSWCNGKLACAVCGSTKHLARAH